MTLPPPTTALPTEPGLYLFRGVYSPKHARAYGSVRREVEIVRVVFTSNGTLSYIGADFIYLAEGTPIGAWIRLDPSLGQFAEGAYPVSCGYGGGSFRSSPWTCLRRLSPKRRFLSTWSASCG